MQNQPIPAVESLSRNRQRCNQWASVERQAGRQSSREHHGEEQTGKSGIENGGDRGANDQVERVFALEAVELSNKELDIRLLSQEGTLPSMATALQNHNQTPNTPQCLTQQHQNNCISVDSPAEISCKQEIKPQRVPSNDETENAEEPMFSLGDASSDEQQSYSQQSEQPEEDQSLYGSDDDQPLQYNSDDEQISEDELPEDYQDPVDFPFLFHAGQPEVYHPRHQRDDPFSYANRIWKNNQNDYLANYRASIKIQEDNDVELRKFSFENPGVQPPVNLQMKKAFEHQNMMNNINRSYLIFLEKKGGNLEIRGKENQPETESQIEEKHKKVKFQDIIHTKYFKTEEEPSVLQESQQMEEELNRKEKGEQRWIQMVKNLPGNGSSSLKFLKQIFSNPQPITNTTTKSEYDWNDDESVFNMKKINKKSEQSPDNAVKKDEEEQIKQFKGQCDVVSQPDKEMQVPPVIGEFVSKEEDRKVNSIQERQEMKAQQTVYKTSEQLEQMQILYPFEEFQSLITKNSEQVDFVDQKQHHYLGPEPDKLTYNAGIHSYQPFQPNDAEPNDHDFF